MEHPSFFPAMDRMVAINEKLVAVGQSDAPDFIKTLQKLPLMERLGKELVLLYFGPTKRVGSLDIEGDKAIQY